VARDGHLAACYPPGVDVLMLEVLSDAIQLTLGESGPGRVNLHGRSPVQVQVLMVCGHADQTPHCST
jgi:hypothetical protein